MAIASASFGNQLLEGESFTPRKRFKASELPLNAAQRSTIDGLLHTIKKKGEYDTLRKKVWSQYAESVSSPSTTCYLLIDTERLNFLAKADS